MTRKFRNYSINTKIQFYCLPVSEQFLVLLTLDRLDSATVDCIIAVSFRSIPRIWSRCIV